MAENKFYSGEADGASAIGHEFDTLVNLTTSGAKLASFKNLTVEKLAVDKDGNLTLSGTVDGVDVAAHDHSDASGQTRLAAKDRRQYAASEKHAADAGATDTLSEHCILQAQEALTITKVFFLPDAALTANDTNYATITVYRRDSSGGTQSSVASIDTDTGGSGDWTAFDGIDLGTISNASVAAGEMITFEITKVAGGVQVPAGTLQVEYTVD